MIPLGARLWDVVCVGDPCVDLAFAVDTLPGHASKALGRALAPQAGGTTSNVACAIARLGGRAAVLGVVGDDSHGPLCRSSFERFGVDDALLRTLSGHTTACAVILVTPDGERSIVYCPMEAPQLDDEALDGALGDARAVYCMPYDLEQLERIAEIAVRHGTCVAVDLEKAVGPDAQGLRARCALADIAFFNEEGFRAATGRAPDAEALASLLTGRTRAVLVTRASAGAVGADASGYFVQSALARPVIDTIGAGDCFNAACLQAWLADASLAEAMREGCAAASFAVGASGARAGLPDSRQLAAALAEFDDA